MPEVPSAAKKSSPARARLSSAAAPHFNPAALRFLRSLARNNRREWFEPRREEFERELKQPMLAVIAAVTDAMAGFAPEHVRPPQKCMMRIYRDTRFSHDKRPYKSNVAAWWSRAGLEKTSGGGYYLHLAPKEVIIAAGVYMPEREQLLAIRSYLLENHAEVRSLLEDRRLRKLLQPIDALVLSRAPKGFPKDHPADDLIRCRQWGVSCTLPPEAALQADFVREVVRRFELAAPLVAALNRPLAAKLERRRAPLFGLR